MLVYIHLLCFTDWNVPSWKRHIINFLKMLSIVIAMGGIVMDGITCSQISYTETLTPGTSEGDLIWKQGQCRENQLTCNHTEVRWAPDPV